MTVVKALIIGVICGLISLAIASTSNDPIANYEAKKVSANTYVIPLVHHPL